MYNDEELFKLSNGRWITDARLSHIMSQIAEIQPERAYQDDSTGYSWDEAGMADLFSELYHQDTRYCPEAKSWYTYESGVWKKDVGGLLISSKIKEFVRLLSLYCGEISDEETRQEYMKFVAKMGDRRFRDRMLKDAADSMRIEASTFDQNPYLLNCKNGTFNLQNLEFSPHRWEDFLTFQTNFDCSVDWMDHRCDRWERFIREVTENDYDKADYLQRALGYSMVGMANEECMFILHGKTTRNGKSTLLAALEHLLGDYASVAPVELICKAGAGSRNPESANPVLAKLKGKRLVTMAESESGGKMDASIIKQYTGGEKITARELYQSAITYIPQFTLWLSCNDLPAVRDKSLFASDRLRIVEFNRHFTEAERDTTLKTYFESQEAMAGIFTWLVIGYRNYRKHGLKRSEAMDRVVHQYEKDNDAIWQFLDACCVKDDDSKTRLKSLYERYKLWAKSENYYIMSMKKFNQELERHPEWYDRIYTVQGYKCASGIKLKEVL